MSIQSQIERLTTDRNTIRAKLVNLGLATSTDTLTQLATKLDAVINQGSPNAEVKEGESYTIEAGYYKGGTVQGVAGGGNYSLQEKTNITPTKSSQTITSDAGYYGLSSVQVNAIPSSYQDVSAVTATSADVLANKVIVDASGTVIAGTMTNNGTISATIDGLTTTSYTLTAGYYAGGTVSLTSDIETALEAI